MAYYWFKAFHIVGFVTWFGGLFYLPRLFIYHQEANEQAEPARSILKQQFQIMEQRLYGIIMTPGMLLTIAMAIALIYTEPQVLHETWLHIKLALVLGLIGYHHYCKRLMKQLAADECKFSSNQLRAVNEVPTVFLVLVVMLGIFKDNFPTSGAAWTVFAMVVAMAATIQLYARKRRLDREKAKATIASEVSEVGA
ncbi:MAG TPA: protoporphyrinogen oxidase HemJ [Thermosynechococcaceae cyanobacterium]